ncbi:PFL family protein [Atopobiaceae bacterium LCP21S3_F11]
MAITFEEVAETLNMVSQQHLDIRTITMGINLAGCADEDMGRMCTKVYDRITGLAADLVPTAEALEREYGIPIVNKRVSVTPIAQIAAACPDADLVPLAHALDHAAETLGIDYLGGYSALVHKGIGDADRRLINCIPQALAETSRVCSSVNVASLRAGINMDAVLMAAQTILDCARLTADRDSVGASKFVCFANMVEDSPFMAGAVHGTGEADAVINVGVSGPGVMAAALEELPETASMMEVAERIKQTAFKITRAGELMSREAAKRLGVEKGIVDLSLAPTPAVGDSVARILEIIGVGQCGGPGTTCALAMLNDAVKKGGVMASSSVGGLSGAFIPVSEDAGMIDAAEAGALSLEKLEAMTCVCSVGLDMIAVPGDTPVEAIAGIIADEMAIGVINNKTTAVRLIPAIGKSEGESVEFGGLFGRAPVMHVNPNAGRVLVHRGGRFPAPLNSLKN